MKRWTFASGALAVALASMLLADVQAQTYPTRPITIVVPAAPGGGGDFTARLLGESLSKSLGQQIVVENKPGANGNLAAQAVARAEPDGYTLLLAYSGSHVANPALFPNLPWDPVKSFSPVALAVTAPHVIVVKKDLPAQTLSELLAYAKQKPGGINYATSGRGSIQHIGTEQLAQFAGTKMVHVPYRGAGPAMTDLLQGTIDLIVTTPPAVVGHVQSKSVKALAIASKQRHPMLPDVPTTGEAGLPNFELDAWFAIYAPAGTPQPVVARLASEIEKVVGSSEFKRRTEESGTYASFKGPAELAEFTKTELAHWSNVIKTLGITAEQ
jgi:tripartite-type tricarboxylate transporter receptor subunit TctC